MPKKLPYLPLYTGDYLKDPKLSLCAPATRGVWMDLLCAMHELDRVGELRGTAEQLSRAARCQPVEFAHAMTDLQATGAADVEERNGTYVVRNRRMRSDYMARKSAADRQLKRRAALCHDSVTREKPPDTDIEDEIEIAFENFWGVFPSGRKQSKSKAREAFRKAIEKIDVPTLLAAAAEYATSPVGQGRFVKMPTTWLNQECWLDDRKSWQAKDDSAPTPKGKEYKTIPPEEFKRLLDAGKFISKPHRDAQNPDRWFGQLFDTRKVECFVAKKPNA